MVPKNKLPELFFPRQGHRPYFSHLQQIVSDVVSELVPFFSADQTDEIKIAILVREDNCLEG